MVSEGKFYIIVFYNMLYIKIVFFVFFSDKKCTFPFCKDTFFSKLFNYVKELFSLSRGFQKNRVVLDLVITSMFIS